MRAISNGDKPAGPTERGIGLTKREAFAMAALQGLCANPNLISKTEMTDIHDGIRAGRFLTNVAHLLADAALESPNAD